MRWLLALVATWIVGTGAAAAQGVVVVPRIVSPGQTDLGFYKGEDGGHMMASMAAPSPTLLHIVYRRAGGSGRGVLIAYDTIMYVVSDFKDSQPIPPLKASIAEPGLSYAAKTYRGSVFTQRLEPGKYEIYELVLQDTGSGRIQRISPTAIPFEVSARGATYVGEFRAMQIRGKTGLGLPGLVGWNVIVTDQSARDLPILRKKHPDLGATEVQVFDVETLGLQLLNKTP